MDRQIPQQPASGSLPAEKWVWKLFTGDAYPYIRRTLQHEKGAPPSADDIRQRFIDVYAHSTVKIMVMELVGILLEFQDLAVHPYGSTDFSGLTHDPLGYLSEHYGGGKYKLSFYYGEQFVATQNFKVGGAPQWNMRKCLASLVDGMKQKASQDVPPRSFAHLLEQLCTQFNLSGSSGAVDSPTFLTLVRLTAGSQYEDYFSILHNCPEPQQLTEHLLRELDAIYQTKTRP
jgi:hypothetical protein